MPDPKNYDAQLAVIKEKVTNMADSFSQMADLMERMVRLEERAVEQKDSVIRAHDKIEILDDRADKSDIKFTRFATIGAVLVFVCSTSVPFVILWIKGI